jgi:hypothetical protein
MEQRIEILFKEYDALRTEIIARTGNIYQLVSIGGGLLAGLLAWHHLLKSDLALWLLLLLVVPGILAFVLTLVDLNRASGRLQELEQEINEMAGADLLKCEKRRRRSIWKIFRRKSK